MGYCLRDENSGLRFGPPGRQRVLDGTFVQLNKLAGSLGMARIQAVTGELECRWYGSELEWGGWNGQIRVGQTTSGSL